MNERPRTETMELPLASEGLPGMRLMGVEVLNWGTFDRRVWPLHLDGENALLTGDIGSGKSTLVDAITTLLIPSQKIDYNKAAGAEHRERDLRSYVLGTYKKERGEAGLSAKSVGLRQPGKSFSVILGRFRNVGFDEDVTLAQIFWYRDTRGQPERFYVVAEKALSIEAHFSNFGSDINALRRRLRKHKGVEVFDTFPTYSAAFRRRFGITNEQALDLFLQTVSMKQVGDLTEFVRAHMLEAFPVEARIAAMLAHFADLTAAHEAVLKARTQIERLSPIVADCDQHDAQLQEMERLKTLRNGLRAYFGGLKTDLIDKRLAEIDAELQRLGERISRFEGQVRDREGARDGLRQAIRDNGGDRITTLEREIDRKRSIRDERQRRAGDYERPAKTLGLDMPASVEAFVTNAGHIESGLLVARNEEAHIENELREQAIALHDWRRQHDEVASELTSLKGRRSSIPSGMLTIRERLCDALDLDAAELPFAGELIEVRKEAAPWEGAAERLVRPFALSLLVPEDRYRDVSAWVNGTHLAARLVYYKVPAALPALRRRAERDALAAKLRVKDGTPFEAWLLRELDERFDHICCEDLERFRREVKAVTRAGQIKGKGERHEKDDRFAIDDRTRYVLGWSNEAKIAALEQQAAALAAKAQPLHAAKVSLEAARGALRDRIGHMQQLSVFRSFNDLDWRSVAVEIERLEAEKRQLAEGSDLLQTLNAQLVEAESALGQARDKLAKAQAGEATQRDRRARDIDLRSAATADLLSVDETERQTLFSSLEALREEALGEQRLTVETCDARERDYREWLSSRVDAEAKRVERLRERITRAMADYAHHYPEETRDVDASPRSAPEYREMLDSLKSDDLPRFEARFKQLLNENAIREIAGFHAQLRREENDIRERIETINASLREIDYNPGRYILLESEKTPDAEVRDFQQDLRKCTESTLSGSEDAAYSEAKFLEVRRIMERFSGRKELTEIDKRWTRKVTDVRNWFQFSASERYRTDDSEHEHYSDSSGKSGGQKEKLAYTVLAASLAYQFGLDQGGTRSRAFHFVMIDEAFGRGSDESAEYALKLFREMGLQLLIATPLQKIHVIEPFVSAVGFVHSEEGKDGKRSMLRNMTIEQYRAERALRRAGASV